MSTRKNSQTTEASKSHKRTKISTIFVRIGNETQNKLYPSSEESRWQNPRNQEIIPKLELQAVVIDAEFLQPKDND